MPAPAPDRDRDRHPSVAGPGPSGSVEARVANIADPYADLSAALDEPRRMGIVALLAVGYYDGWRPTREEVADPVRATTGESAQQHLDLHRLHWATTPAHRGAADPIPGDAGPLDHSCPVSS